MEVSVDRRARRVIEDAGGLVTVEVRAAMGCMVTRHVEVRPGKPDDLDGFSERQAGPFTVFARGVLDGPEGARPLSESALPARVKIRHQEGTLVGEAR